MLTYTHRLNKGVQFSGTYSWSHVISDAPDANSFEQNLSIEDPTNLLRDRGNSTINRPQSLTFSTILQPEFHFSNKVLNAVMKNNMFAFLGNLSSGDQQNVTAKTILNGDAKTSGVTRPLFVGRNSVRGPAIYQIDLRYTRTIATLWERVKPQFFLEASNLFNHPNVTSLNTAVLTNSAGVPVNSLGAEIPLPTTFSPTSTVLEGRIVQVGLGVSW